MFDIVPSFDMRITALDHALPRGAYKAFVGIDTKAGGGDMCWMHRFNAVAGGETITGIHCIFGSASNPGYNPPNGTPCFVYVWDDPTEDGDPSDAVLVAAEPTTVQNVDTDIYNIITLSTPPTIVDEFYIGCVLTQGAAPIDQTTPYVWGNAFFCGTNTPGGFWEPRGPPYPRGPRGLGRIRRDQDRYLSSRAFWMMGSAASSGVSATVKRSISSLRIVPAPAWRDSIHFKSPSQKDVP